MTNSNHVLENITYVTNDPDRIHIVITKEMNKIKYLSFGKLSISVKNTLSDEFPKLLKEIKSQSNVLSDEEKDKQLGMVNEKLVKLIYKEQKLNLERNGNNRENKKFQRKDCSPVRSEK